MLNRVHQQDGTAAIEITGLGIAEVVGENSAWDLRVGTSFNTPTPVREGLAHSYATRGDHDTAQVIYHSLFRDGFLK